MIRLVAVAVGAIAAILVLAVRTGAPPTRRASAAPAASTRAVTGPAEGPRSSAPREALSGSSREGGTDSDGLASLERRVWDLLAAGEDPDALAALAEAYDRLANTGSPLAGPVRWTLLSATLDASEEARRTAVEGLGSAGNHGALLAALFRQEDSTSVRAELVRVLAPVPGFLRSEMWRERDANVRRFAAEMCRIALSPEDSAWIAEVETGEPDPEVRRALRESARALSGPARPRR